MGRTSSYTVLGLAVVMVAGVFVVFSDADSASYDYTGIAQHIRQGDNGYTFDLQTSSDGTFRCFARDSVSDLGYYAVAGEFSDDGTIFFVSSIHSLDS